ncbi:glycosyltransferase [Roseivivax sp. CAU 1761]
MTGPFSSRVALVDPCCPAPYAMASLDGRGLGGTEATVLRVFGGLAGAADTIHYQHGRGHPACDGTLRFAPLEIALHRERLADTIVVINSWKVARRLRRLNPEARILVWLHNIPGRHNRRMGQELAAAGIEVLTVSDSQRRRLVTFLREQSETLPRVLTVANPIEDSLRPDATRRDPDRLFFASAPHKGLAEVFDRFEAMRAHFPGLRLRIADPGYMSWPLRRPPEGAEILGPLPRAQVIDEMRRALCLFYPQTTFAETFGLVIAEANAVGCPAILHRGLGANDEVASSAEQVFDTTDDAQLADRLRRWRELAPAVAARDEFRLPRVLDRWREVLRLGPAPTARDLRYA